MGDKEVSDMDISDEETVSNDSLTDVTDETLNTNEDSQEATSSVKQKHALQRRDSIQRVEDD